MMKLFSTFFKNLLFSGVVTQTSEREKSKGFPLSTNSLKSLILKKYFCPSRYHLSA